METFDLKGREFIKLNKFLKVMRLVETGGEAKICIENGEVLVNVVVELRKRNKLKEGFIIELRDQQIIIKG